MSKKRFKAIFGNPPFSLPAKNGGKPTCLWMRFSEKSLEMADEVYYITPSIWNGDGKRLMGKLAKNVDVDFTADQHFSVYSNICYWNYRPDKKDGVKVYTAKKTYNLESVFDIEFIPYDMDNTLSIHKKIWSKESMGFKIDYKIRPESNIVVLSKVKDELYKHKCFYLKRDDIRYISDKVLDLYPKEYFHSPKIMIPLYTDNTPFLDSVGEYATEGNNTFLMGNNEDLAIRYKQLESNLAKFYFYTARKDMRGSPAVMLYIKAPRLFPNIPLEYTADDDIYKWLDLTEDEIKIVEKYAGIVDRQNERRRIKNEKAV